MSSDVRHLVEYGPGYSLVRLTGVVDADTAADVRATLLEVLAEQPEALVADVAEARAAGDSGREVLAELHRVTADWPASRLVLCCSPADDQWRTAGWSLWPDTAGAVAGLGPAHPDDRLGLTLEPHVSAARQAREQITAACARWARDDLADAACIVATEMVNNVVAHARTPMRLLLAVRGDGLSVAVRDRSAVVPTYDGGPVSPTAYGGRGMLLIDSVARRWGSLRLAAGKVVWALLEEDTGKRANAHDASLADPARG